MPNYFDRQTQSHSFSRFASSVRPKHLTLWGLGGIVLLMVSCQSAPKPLPAPAPETSRQAAPNLSTPDSSASDSSASDPSASDPSALKRYEFPQAGFGFTYPADFAIPDKLVSSPDEILTLELWQQDVYDAIVAGKYEGGTEYPPNVQVVIDRNPDSLDLQTWVESQPDRFSQPRNFQTRSIAGQNRLSFRSTGLYEHENVVLAHPSGETVIAVSLATIGNAEVDEPNRRAFTQILESLQVSSPTQP